MDTLRHLADYAKSFISRCLSASSNDVPHFLTNGILFHYPSCAVCLTLRRVFSGVHAFGYNSAQSEPIRMKSGAV